VNVISCTTDANLADVIMLSLLLTYGIVGRSMRRYSAKMAGPIKRLFDMWARVGISNNVLVINVNNK